MTENKFIKFDQEKAKLSLIPTAIKTEIAKILHYGNQKYGFKNWEKCEDKTRYIDAALRHIDQYISGDMLDDETGYHHLAHAICSLIFIYELDIK